MTFLPSGPADSEAFSRLFVRLQSSSAYAIIIIQTSEGPQDFALLPTLVHNKQHLIAVTPPALVDGDPCQQCPGWFVSNCEEEPLVLQGLNHCNTLVMSCITSDDFQYM